MKVILISACFKVQSPCGKEFYSERAREWHPELQEYNAFVVEWRAKMLEVMPLIGYPQDSKVIFLSLAKVHEYNAK